MGWVGMVIIGRRQSKSTFGASNTFIDMEREILANNIDLMTFDVISHFGSGAEVGSTRRTGSRLLASVQPQVLSQLGKEDNVNNIPHICHGRRPCKFFWPV